MPQRKLFDKKSLSELKKHPLYSQDGKGNDAVASVRIFNPYGRGVIYLTEYDGDDTLYGYWKDSDASEGGEYGYFSKKELENTRVRIGGVSLPLERDSGFKPTTMGKIRYPKGTTTSSPTTPTQSAQTNTASVSASSSTAAKAGTVK